MKIRPLNDWAVIQRIELKEKTPGGIIIPDTAKEKPAEGIITAIGPGRYKKETVKGKEEKTFVPTTLTSGERVIFPEYMTTEIEIDGEEIVLIREENILGTVEASDQLAVKREHRVQVETPKPVIIKEHAEIMTVPQKGQIPPTRKDEKKKTAPPQKAAAKTKKAAREKTVKSKKKTPKKAAVKKATPSAKKKTAGKKAAAKKKAVEQRKAASKKKNAAKKRTAKKKTITGKSVKKTPAKKAVKKKSAPKASSIPVSKKTAERTQSKKAASGKANKKTVKKRSKTGKN